MDYKDDKHKLIWDFQREILKIYRENELNSLEGLNQDFLIDGKSIDGKNILAWFFDVVRKGMVKFEDFDFHKSFDDLCLCCDEIMFFTAHLYLYAPYLYNPIEHGYLFSGKMLYPYSRTIENKRFNMYVNICFEKVYNYWDRIGDLLTAYFPELIDPKRTYFASTIDKIPAEFRTSDSYQWLKNFRDDDFSKLNKKRIDIVHYVTNDTSFKWDHANDPHDKANIEKMLETQRELLSYFKSHLSLSIIGFVKTVFLIKEITDSRLRDIK